MQQQFPHGAPSLAIGPQNVSLICHSGDSGSALWMFGPFQLSFARRGFQLRISPHVTRRIIDCYQAAYYADAISSIVRYIKYHVI